ncbi:MAG: helix-turn-helix transcriptional regulator [Clostridia bacterium]|jgi:transcriptional regulator with XRE-family HTH domain|nr:helix-turn-helix transcriptional regulator [Clostridia bacterium]
MDTENNNQKQKEIFAQNLQYWLKQRNKTQMDLMNDLNLSSSTVSDWCNAKKYPRMGTVQMLADYLGVLKSDLVEEKNTESIKNNAYFRIMQTAKEKGYTPEDLMLAMDFLDRARKRDTTDEN